MSDRHLKLNIFKLTSSLAPSPCPKPTIATVFPPSLNCNSTLPVIQTKNLDDFVTSSLFFLYPTSNLSTNPLVSNFKTNPGLLPSTAITKVLILGAKIFHLDYTNRPSLVSLLLFYLSLVYFPHCNEKSPLNIEANRVISVQNANILSYPK